MSVLSRINAAVFGRQAQPRGITRGPARPPHYPMPTIETAPRTFMAERVDVEAVLVRLATENAQKLDWRDSIVELMQLLGLAGSLAERRELADELGYQGKDTAAMDIWLHEAVLRQLSMKSGRVSASLWEGKIQLIRGRDNSITDQGMERR